jgi:hypothetical protein
MVWSVCFWMPFDLVFIHIASAGSFEQRFKDSVCNTSPYREASKRSV